jgi:hypothetical protein
MKSDDKPPQICISAHTSNVFRNDNRELHTGNYINGLIYSLEA